MRYCLGGLFLILMCFCGLFAQDSGKADCPLLLLTKNEGQLNLERLKISNNAVEVFPINEKSETLSIIFAYSPGMSGDFVKLNEKKMMIATCRGGQLQIKIRKEDGTEKELPALNAANYEKFNIRVNVTGKTIKKAFKAIPNKEIEVDKDGPVIDMFGGKIPIGENDYAITVEITEPKSIISKSGEADLEYDKYLFVKAKLDNGKAIDFIVDFAAAQSILVKNILPATAELTEAKSVEYSEKGKRILDYAAGGAGGAVKGLMFTKAAGFEIGNVKFLNQEFLVIDALPKLAGREIGGIIGLDLLQQAKKVSISFPIKPDDKGRLVFADNSLKNLQGEFKIPFSVAFNHLYLKGSLGNQSIEFILDTGSPDSIITTETARLANIKESKNIELAIKGLDGNPLLAQKTELSGLKIGDSIIPQIPVMIADLPIFQQRGISKTGLLGNSFLKQFSRIEVDFEAKLLRLQK